MLLAWSRGDKQAFDLLVPLVHDELRRLARGYMARERPDHTLQASALVNEAYVRLIELKQMRWQNRAHFFAMSARVMRRILVDFARARRNDKRGGGRRRSRWTKRCSSRQRRGRISSRSTTRCRRSGRYIRARVKSWNCASSAGSASRKPRKRCTCPSIP